MDDNFFIRLRDRPTVYLHPFPLDIDDQLFKDSDLGWATFDGNDYVLMEGQAGAAIFSEEYGKRLLKFHAPSNMELIAIDDTMNEPVINPDRLSILQDIATKMSVIALILISFILIVCHCG